MEIYALTDSVLTPTNDLYSVILRLCNAGVKLIQYRNKNAVHDEILLAKISQLCKEKGVKFIVNDDAMLAKKVGADGVHVGKDDFSVLKARKILGNDAIVGASCYDSIQKAIKAQNDGASYAAFGAVFPSITKPAATPCKLEILTLAKKELKIPVCAIGGINAANIAAVAKTGCDYAAIISAIYKNAQIEQNINELLVSIKG